MEKFTRGLLLVLFIVATIGIVIGFLPLVIPVMVFGLFLFIIGIFGGPNENDSSGGGL